jgi:50S ribosomal protein L16 3-hydroxylase
MKTPLGELSPEEFLRGYWQKKPLLIRQAFPDFVPELDVNDIAGLACDELAEARLITGRFPEHDWRIRYGPFREEELRSLPESAWSLLVQDVEKHYPPLLDFMSAFEFLPRWRMDDLMISVAGPGGSVGPHVDQYDVFLLQAEGSRRWQIAERFDAERLPDCELNVLRAFTAEREWILETGDMLYLPPGVAHHGVALEAGMTWSVGMRAPSAADLLQSMGEWLAATRDEGERFSDPGIPPAGRTGEIDARAISGFRELANSLSRDYEGFPLFLGSFLSRYRLSHKPAPPSEFHDPAGLQESIRNGAKLRHNPWTRLLWIETQEGATLFAAGSAHACTVESARMVCEPGSLGRPAARFSEAELSLLCELLNQGHLYLETL